MSIELLSNTFVIVFRCIGNIGRLAAHIFTFVKTTDSIHSDLYKAIAAELFSQTFLFSLVSTEVPDQWTGSTLYDEEDVEEHHHHENDCEEHHCRDPADHCETVPAFPRPPLLTLLRRIRIRTIPLLKKGKVSLKASPGSVLTFCLDRLQFHPSRITLSRVKGKVRRARSMGTARAMIKS